MSRIKDPRVIEGKKSRNASIRKQFEKLINKNLAYDYVIGEIIKSTGFSESTIIKIIKRAGAYKD